jgi:alpha-beta hydrolase superfamily lysophospholipase
MKAKALGLLQRGVVIVAVALFTILAVRVWDKERGPPLQPWHTYVPAELDGAALAAADWSRYVAAEDALFEDVRRNVSGKLEGAARNPANRYFAGSPLHPDRFERDWNRSFVLEPAATPTGAVVLLHGLTDSPYSMRHVAQRYRERGYVAIGIRLPAHGTVPAALAKARWKDWLAATRLAVREARRRAGPSVPLHLVGYSNGGALAVKYALDALADPDLDQPARIVLISPMIGVTAFARFAGVLGWPAVIPAFAKTAWLGIEPEYNPFKYNSFPVNGARQSSLLSRELQAQILSAGRDGTLARLPPIITFQSVVDFTVSVPALINGLYAALPANGSELVLFDINRRAEFELLLRPAAGATLGGLLPPAPRRYTTTIIGNLDPQSADVVERVARAGESTERTLPLRLDYPPGVFSLSHVAVPFPLSDALYGLTPDPTEDFGIHLGAIAVRGERGLLITSQDALTRLLSNPFFPYMLERIDQGIPAAEIAAGP